MRDPNRIDVILKQLGNIWKEYPDIRLGQFIINAVSIDSIYYIEDDILINRIRELYIQPPEKSD